MADLDHRFKDLDRLDPPTSWSDVRSRRPGPPLDRPGRPRRVLAIATALAIAGAGIALVLRAFLFGPSGPTSVATSPPPPSESPSASPPPPGWIRHTDDAGVSIDTPAAWDFNSDPVPALVEPAVLFGVGTGAFPTGGDCAPRAALDALPPEGALFVVMEYHGVDEPFTFPPRADRFHLGPLGGPSECWGVRNDLILFEDGGRYFQAQAVFGPSAPPSLHDAVTRSLDTLHVDPVPASDQPAARCRAGRWAFCSQAAWVYQVMTQAHLFLLGPRGDQAILGLAAKHSFALWTTSTRPQVPGPCRSVGGARVCRMGDRLVWAAQGLWLWVEPAPSPYASLGTTPGVPTGSTLERLVQASQDLRLLTP